MTPPITTPTAGFHVRSDVKSLFEEAITRGQFGIKPERADYVGDWMYMGTTDGVDAFKHVLSRLYWPACPRCHGEGQLHMCLDLDRGVMSPRRCEDCGGSGELEVAP